MNEQILWLNLRTASQSIVLREELWDDLLTWCLARSLFIGGSLDGAVVYVPGELMSRLLHRQLKAWLEKRADIHDFAMEVMNVSSLHSPMAKAAYIEAVSQAQESLAERMAGCALSLVALITPLDRRWLTSMSAGGTSLELRLPRSQIQMGISRLDRTPSPELDRLANQRLSLVELESLIPVVVALHWYQLEFGGDLSVGEWTAERRDWRINLYADPGSRLDHRDVMLRWMEWVCTG